MFNDIQKYADSPTTPEKNLSLKPTTPLQLWLGGGGGGGGSGITIYLIPVHKLESDIVYFIPKVSCKQNKSYEYTEYQNFRMKIPYTRAQNNFWAFPGQDDWPNTFYLGHNSFLAGQIYTCNTFYVPQEHKYYLPLPQLSPLANISGTLTVS